MHRVISRNVTRRGLLKLTALAGAMLLGAGVGIGIGPMTARKVGAQGFEGVSDELIHGFGYPEVTVTAGPDGADAPSDLAAGLTVVNLAAPEGYLTYVDIVTVPEGLSDDVLAEQGLAAGSGDVPQEGWVYHGGTNSPTPGQTTSFIIDLKPGEYRWAISFYKEYVEGEEFVETMFVPRLTVAAGEASPEAVAEPPSTVTLEETDGLEYIVTPDPVPTGPQLWKITNTGHHHAHHVVMIGIPESVTKQQIITEFNGMMAGTPTPPEASFWAQATPAGYAALQSGGQTTWAEFDLAPGHYAVICFIFDPETMRPHAADGMITLFSVE